MLSLKGDSSIDGLLLASVTSYQFQRRAPNVDVVNANESMNPHIVFVALQDIFPTLIATLPIGPDDKAIRLNQKSTDYHCAHTKGRRREIQSN